MRTTIVLSLAILCLGAASARNLKEQVSTIAAPCDESRSEVSTLSLSEANALADVLIESLETANTEEVSLQGSEAADILATAVDGSGGVQATAIILTRLSEYVEENGCTDPVKAQIENLLESEYEGNTFAMTSALRALDVRTTPVAALGACLQETTEDTSESVAMKSDEGN
ncbi:hypothetical protein Ndes2526A_g07699 [Nannochloris sp. 'desiccata']|nr:hypothetical protein KSW81_002459 [Chlorella desiccata (nom. nud.)]